MDLIGTWERILTEIEGDMTALRASAMRPSGE